MSWWDKEKPGEEVQSIPTGVDALGMPCFWKFFRFPCPYCQEASRYFQEGDEDKGRQICKKRTLFGLTFFSSTHEKLEKFNGKVVVINVPSDHVVGEIAKRLKIPVDEGGWGADPSDLAEGYFVVVRKQLQTKSRFAEYLIGKGKAMPIKKETVIKVYEKLGLYNPKQDKFKFLDWIYNQHPELVVTSWADIPLDAKFGLRFLPWPWWLDDGKVVPETDVDPDADPFKCLYFHRMSPVEDFYRLKEAGFDPTAVTIGKKEERAEAEDDLTVDGSNFSLDEV